MAMTVAANGDKRLSLDKRALTRRTSLTLPDAMPLDSWVSVGQEIAVISDASAWWLADWLIYGRDKYPKRYRHPIDRTSLSYQTLRNYAWIARAFPMSRRRDKLSMQHHAQVVTLLSVATKPLIKPVSPHEGFRVPPPHQHGNQRHAMRTGGQSYSYGHSPDKVKT
jgi:hypothetical protein